MAWSFGSFKFEIIKKPSLIFYVHDDKPTCEVCIQAKMIRKLFPKIERISNLLEIVHYDICELNDMLTRGGHRYFITFIDNFSKFTCVLDEN